MGDGANFMEGWRDSSRRCFKCGATGHFAKDCTAEQQADMNILGSDSSEGEGLDAALPRSSRDGRAAAASGMLPKQQQQDTLRPPFQPGSSSGLQDAAPPQPWADVADQFASVMADPTEEGLTGMLQQVFGFPAFRGLQLQTIQRLLHGQSLLSIMPTGEAPSLEAGPGSWGGNEEHCWG